MGKKCCTKKEECSNEPICDKKMDFKTLIIYVVVANLFLLIFRILVIKKEETAHLVGSVAQLWWYTKFILFFELQLFFVYVLYGITVQGYFAVLARLRAMIHSLRAFLGAVRRNSFMNWIRMNKLYWVLVKIGHFISVLWNAFLLFVILAFYGLLLVVFAPYLMGYYDINSQEARR